jgi:hypothetical protein
LAYLTWTIGENTDRHLRLVREQSQCWDRGGRRRWGVRSAVTAVRSDSIILIIIIIILVFVVNGGGAVVEVAGRRGRWSRLRRNINESVDVIDPACGLGSVRQSIIDRDTEAILQHRVVGAVGADHTLGGEAKCAGLAGTARNNHRPRSESLLRLSRACLGKSSNVMRNPRGTKRRFSP